MITYKELLSQIGNKENHLLVANGFNYGLGINTGYSAIFEKMIEDNNLYIDIKPLFKECGYDLEEFLGRLESNIDNLFLRKYIRNNIKLDFMRATHEIVKSNIKDIYAEKNEGIFLLLKNFTNYFTLNYDSFLYILLLRYKPMTSNESNAIAFEANINFIEKELDKISDNIYSEIKEAREKGLLTLSLGNGSMAIEESLDKLTKTHFISEIKTYSKVNNKKWKDKDIKRVINKILKEEQNQLTLKNIDDGSKQLKIFKDQSEFIFENRKTQNLFFLHGAFHIYKDGKIFKKITQQSDKALYEKLEDVLNKDSQDIVCVFQNTNKMDVIKDHEYLQNCFNKLDELSGNMVIIGSSLANNDNHIFSRINNSRIKKVYISALRKEKEEIQERAEVVFSKKEICLFDAETISYEMPDEENGN